MDGTAGLQITKRRKHLRILNYFLKITKGSRATIFLRFGFLFFRHAYLFDRRAYLFCRNAYLFVGAPSFFVGTPSFFVGSPSFFVGTPSFFVGEPLVLIGKSKYSDFTVVGTVFFLLKLKNRLSAVWFYCLVIRMSCGKISGQV